MLSRYKTYIYIIIALLALLIIANIYRSFFMPNIVGGGSSAMANLLFLVLGLGLGVLLFRKSLFGKKEIIRQDSTIMLQKIERVFKVVTAEGYFSEIVDYSHTANIADLMTSTKKALLIVNAKVMMGYDFKKLRTEIDTTTNKLRIVEFPKPEVLSIDPTIKYYNMENGLFNKFTTDDHTNINYEAKQKILSKVDSSDLPMIAQRQMQHLISEIKEINQWQLSGEEKILLPSSG